MKTTLPYFKSYDIRGTAPDQLNTDVAYRIGRAVAGWSGVEEIVVGRDARLSSPDLTEALINGLRDSSVTVLDMGVVTTPMLNYAVARFERYGLMITASHNPKQYNGIKIIDPHVEQVYYGRGLEEIEKLVAENSFKESRGKGRVLLRSVLDNYEDYLYERFQDAGLDSLPLVVVDCSNGVGGIPLRVLERLGVQHTLLYHIPNGNFPNHECDTLRVENLQHLQKAVQDLKAGIGVMLDGDSDRVVFVDEEAKITPLDLVFVLLARQELEQNKGRMFYDLRFSRVVKEEIEALEGIPIMLRVGNPFHKEALHKYPDAILAAELSGHIMYKEHFGIDDPLYATLKLLSYLARTGDSLARQIKPLKRYAGSGEIRIKTKDPADLVEKIKTNFKNGIVTEVDGTTIQYPDWWFNIRPSNTEPVAKLVIEADSAAALEKCRNDVLSVLKDYGGEIETP